MNYKIVQAVRCGAFAFALFTGFHAAVAAEQSPSPSEQQSIVDRAQSIVQSGAPEQAATIQMGITPEQLSALVGPQQPEQQTTKKFVYKPKEATDVGEPPRLFYNIPKWRQQAR